jgi:mRNA interferase MazF
MKYSKWSIFRANLDPVVGSEQGKSRPVLILSEDYINDVLNVLNVIPITSRKEGRDVYPNEVLLNDKNYGLEKESILLCHQIRSIDKKRLSKKYGSIQDDKTKNEIFDALIFQFGIPLS